ncbi:MAG TPA: hypothetical protein VHA74_03415 [Candidatus Dojkabacteria bacterium]|nr:hypothetical protein [Candidatus Dojkabacteria bacterium]
MLSEIEIEKIEHKYLKKFYHFLKYSEDEMLYGFDTKEKIKKDWIGEYKSGISDFAVGAERIVYALLNGKGIGQPNSCPVGSDLFFEVKDAFVHIDLKTVQTENIGDYKGSIFVGKNQNSYKSEIKQYDGSSFNPKRNYHPALPTFYNKGTDQEKICLTYFVTILYERENLNILNINIISMPNGELANHYKSRVLKAGKNPDKTRFNLVETSTFELLENTPSRIKVIYFNEEMSKEYRDDLNFYEEIYSKQNN